MGWNFRRTLNLGGGFRINLSKRGIGASGGVKGFRAGLGPSPHFSQRDYIEGCKPDNTFTSMIRGRSALLPRQQTGKLDADCSDSALQELIARFPGLAIPSLPIWQITRRQAPV